MKGKNTSDPSSPQDLTLESQHAPFPSTRLWLSLPCETRVWSTDHQLSSGGTGPARGERPEWTGHPGDSHLPPVTVNAQSLQKPGTR